MRARPSQKRNKNETGGLSGAPLFAPSTAMLKAMRQRVGTKLVLVGVGGVGSGADAYAKIRAGASLVQLYTALAYEGPGLIAAHQARASAHCSRAMVLPMSPMPWAWMPLKPSANP